MLQDKFTAVVKQCLPTYEIMGTLGQGIHGSVFHVKDNLKERAVKVVPIHVERSTLFREDADLDSKVSRDFHAVCSYYEKVKGSDVVTIHDFHLVDKKISSGYAEAFLVILMACCKGNLQDLVLEKHPLAPASICGYAAELANMMARMSRVSGETFLLTDFKPSNILVSSEGSLLMGDLGGLKRVSSVSSAVGGAQFTPNWSAPELILKGAKPDIVSGVYSLGLVIYYLCEGRLPHEEADFIDRIRLIREEGPDFTRSDLPEALVAAVEKALQFEREDRLPSFEAVIDALAMEPEKKERSHTPEPGVKPSAPEPKKSSAVVAARALPRHLESFTGLSFAWIEEGHLALRDGGHSYREFVPGFYMATTPVTQSQWRRVMKTNPSHFPKSPDHPVEMVAWKEAVSFCQHLTEISQGKHHYFLPSEAQWLFAARGGSESDPFAGGADLDVLGWHLGNASFSTQEVAGKEANGFGLYDMCGNVQEWCDSPLGCFSTPLHGERDHVVRGGSWNQSVGKCTLSARRVIADGLKYSNLGFRVAMVPAESVP